VSQFESAFEEKFYNERRAKLEQIAALGQQPYPNSFAYTTDVPTIKQQYDAPTAPISGEQLEADKPTAAIAGRIVAIRLQGKAGFATLQQGGQRLQLYVRKDDVGDTIFDLYKLLDLGDHIGATGNLMRTRTGELTLKVGALSPAPPGLNPDTPAITFLAKAMLPLPDKHSGLGDIELRYRRRYLDLFTDTGDTPEPTTNDEALKGTGFSPSGGSSGLQATEMRPKEPGALAPEGTDATPAQTRLPARQVFLKRAAILRAIRNFFDSRGYIEVETPMLHTIAGGAAARTFTTHHNAEDMALTLRIAPELHLKRLVVGGFDRVYEINRNFRNEGVDTTHNPEFTMLEFYQAYANYHDLMDLTEELIKTVAMEVNGTTLTNFNGRKIDLSKWTKLSMREAIIKWWPPEANPAPNLDTFKSLASLKTCIKSAFDLAVQFYKEASDKFDRGDGESDENFLVTGGGDIAFYRGPLSNIHHPFGFLIRDIISDNVSLGQAIATVFEAVAESHLQQPHIIYDFPLAVSPLSKVKPDEPEWTERFEFYIGGFEVGNAFSELNDPDDQRNRFLAQVADKDPESMSAVDEDYVRALGYGLPPTAGEGIGIDRLTMLLTGSRSIRDVILFPLMRPRATEAPSS
jgi:lysyl-tRNA synthetase class 2